MRIGDLKELLVPTRSGNVVSLVEARLHSGELIQEVPWEEVHNSWMASHGTPTWQPQTGRLMLGVVCIGKFSLRRSPTGFECILQAFEEAKWALSIPNPFRGRDARKIYELVHRLNNRVEVIRFHVQKGGKAIYWLPHRVEAQSKRSQSQRR